MSYSRFGRNDSDVYVFVSSSGHLECCGCILQASEYVENQFKTTDEMVAHLRRHIDAGHTVPEHVIPNLMRDREENDRYIVEHSG